MGAALVWSNHFTAQNLVATPSNGGDYSSASFDAAYPALNAVDPDPSKVARMNFVRSGTGTYVLPYFEFSTTSAAQGTLRGIAMLNIRLPASCTSVDLATYTYLGGGIGTITYTAANLVPIPGTTDRYNLFNLLTADVAGAAVGLVVSTPINTNDYVEVGYVWASPALVFADGAYATWKQGIVDPSEIERARGGALVASKLPHRRTLSCEFDSKTYAAAMGTPGSSGVLNYRRFMAEVGESSPVIVMPRTPLNPASPTSEELHALQTMSIYASFIGQHEIGHAGGNLYRSSTTFEEIR